MDNTREKLIELLCNAHSKATEAGAFDDATYAQQLEIEADYLIANGVTIPERCKNCKYRQTTEVPPIPSYCTKHNKMPVSGDDYCSFGERKENG